MSKVEEKTIRDLCKRIASNSAHLMPNDEEAVVVYQDLIGHATVEENRNLANEPALMESFYRVYGAAYGTIAAIKFYMDNSDRIYNLKAELKDYKEHYEAQKNANKSHVEFIDRLKDDLAQYKGKVKAYERVINEHEENIKNLNDEIIRLKAEMYDLMKKGENT